MKEEMGVVDSTPNHLELLEARVLDFTPKHFHVFENLDECINYNNTFYSVLKVNSYRNKLIKFILEKPYLNDRFSVSIKTIVSSSDVNSFELELAFENLDEMIMLLFSW